MTGANVATVGFIGLGSMGRAAARNLQRAGFALVVHDLRREAGAPLEEHGATWADSPAAVIRARPLRPSRP